ncbi:hypothetical protein EV182_000926 [Spiromyces aspiralis]|uniref:Uncharacterized protein n=1 Tax=Spiromyces aspiralis TaxID=68401 RepID=A0ACC1HVC1_9FUNG|nr:hypothetical protein EV182_000926 [Spiromyces aspiralis]
MLVREETTAAKPGRAFFSLSNHQPYTLPVKEGAVTHALWNPRYDLLAAVDGHSLMVTRLSGGGQLAWRYECHSRISGICWHPNGQTIALVDAAGNMTLVDYESGKPTGHLGLRRDEGRETEMDVRWMEWQQMEVDRGDREGLEWVESLVIPPIEQYLPRISPLSDSDGDRNTQRPLGEPEPTTAIREGSRPAIDALFVVDAQGRLWVALFGTFLLPPVDLGISDPARSILHAAITPDLSELMVCHAAGDSQLSITAVDTGPIHTDPALLYQVASSSAACIQLCHHLATATKALTEHYEAGFVQAAAQFQGMVNHFYTMLENQGMDNMTSPGSELVQLLVTGHPTELVTEFLLSGKTRRLFRQWQKTLDNAEEGAWELVVKHCLPAAERLVLKLGQLISFVQALGGAKNPFDVEGIAEPLLDLVAILGWHYGQFVELTRLLDKCKCDATAFGVWFQFAIKDVQWLNSQGLYRNQSSEDEDEDDKPRPAKPVEGIKFKSVMGYIKRHFGRMEPGARECELDAFFTGCGEDIDKYLDAVVRASNPQALLRLFGYPRVDNNGQEFRFVFHQDLAEAGIPMLRPPSLAEMCDIVQRRLTELFAVPASAIHKGFVVDSPLPSITFQYPVTGDSGGGIVCSLMHLADDEGRTPTHCIAVVTSDKLYLIRRPLGGSEDCRSVPLSWPFGADEDVTVVGIDFFDDRHLVVLARPATEDSKTCWISELEFMPSTESTPRTRQVGELQPGSRLQLACNGLPRRRVVAAIEMDRAGGCRWWPFDLDHDEPEAEKT